MRRPQTHIWKMYFPPHGHPHIPDSLWHRTLAVTLSVYWLGCPGVADQPLGLREALSCCPHPLPFILPLPLAACGSCGTCLRSRPRKRGWGWGASNKTKSGEGGVGDIHYNEDMPLAIHNRVHGDRAAKVGGSSHTGLGPQGGMATSSVSGQALAPWPWPHSQGWGRGRKGSWSSSSCGSQLPHLQEGQLHQDRQPPQVLAPGGGLGQGTHFLPAPAVHLR